MLEYNKRTIVEDDKTQPAPLWKHTNPLMRAWNSMIKKRHHSVHNQNPNCADWNHSLAPYTFSWASSCQKIII